MYVLLEYYGKTRRVLHHGVSDCCTFLVVCSLSVLRSTHLIPCLNIKHQEIFVQPFFFTHLVFLTGTDPVQTVCKSLSERFSLNF